MSKLHVKLIVAYSMVAFNGCSWLETNSLGSGVILELPVWNDVCLTYNAVVAEVSCNAGWAVDYCVLSYELLLVF